METGEIEIWCTSTRTRHYTLYGHKADILCMCASHDGQYLVSSSLDGTVLMWTFADLHPRILWISVTGVCCECLCISRNNYIVCGFSDGHIRVFGGSELTTQYTRKDEDPIISVTVSYDGTYILYTSATSGINYWNIITNECKTSANYDDLLAMRVVLFSSDDHLIFKRAYGYLCYRPYQSESDEFKVQHRLISSFCITPDNIYVLYANESYMHCLNLLTYHDHIIDNTECVDFIYNICMNYSSIYYRDVKERDVYKCELPYADCRILLYYIWNFASDC